MMVLFSLAEILPVIVELSVKINILMKITHCTGQCVHVLTYTYSLTNTNEQSYVHSMHMHMWVHRHTVIYTCGIYIACMYDYTQHATAQVCFP